MMTANLLGALAGDPAERQGGWPIACPSQAGIPRSGELGALATVSRSAGNAEISQFPYALLIRKLVARGEILSAAHLLTFVEGQRVPANNLSRLRAILGPALTHTKRTLANDRSREYEWLGTKGRTYQGEWVAVSGDTLLGHASSLADLVGELRAICPHHRPLIHWIDPGNA